MEKVIYAIDDDRDIRDLLKEILEPAGYRVRTFESCDAAMSRASGPLPDLVILDLMIPGEDGFETCRRLSGDARTSSVPIIILSARTSVQNKLQGFCCGAKRYLTKPFNLDELLHAVGGVLGLPEEERAAG